MNKKQINTRTCRAIEHIKVVIKNLSAIADNTSFESAEHILAVNALAKLYETESDLTILRNRTNND